MSAATTATPKRPRLATHDDLAEANRAGLGNRLTVGEALSVKVELDTP